MLLKGHKNEYKTVSAQAVEDSKIIKLPVAAFQEVLQDYPDSLIQIIQVVMVRLQRVIFTALHQYFGLSSELVQNVRVNEQNVYKKDSYLKLARKILVKELKLDNEDLLQGKVEIHKIPTNTYVMQEDSHNVRIYVNNFFLNNKTFMTRAK